MTGLASTCTLEPLEAVQKLNAKAHIWMMVCLGVLCHYAEWPRNDRQCALQQIHHRGGQAGCDLLLSPPLNWCCFSCKFSKICASSKTKLKNLNFFEKVFKKLN